MSDWQEQEVIDTYIQTQNKNIAELHGTISMLETKIKLLEKTLEEERKDREELPIPKTFIKNTQELRQKVEKLENDLAYYKRHVPTNVIINRENKEKPTRRGGIPKE